MSWRRQSFGRLVAQADVVVANLPLEVLEKVGLTMRLAAGVKPDIILVMPSAFGPDGPYRDRVGFDGVAQAMSGAMSLTGFPEAPARSIVPWADYGTALHAAFGAMAALLQRAATGQGQSVDVSLLSTGIMFMTPFLMERTLTGIERKRQGNTGYYSAPSDTYATRDGWLLVPTIGQPMFRRWVKLMRREDLLNDPRLSDDLARGNNAHLINEVMAAWCAMRTRDEAIVELEQARIPCGPVYELDEVTNDPQVQARHLMEQVPFSGHDTPLPLGSVPLRLGNFAGGVRRAAPRLGEHTDEILAEIGFSAADIERFRREQAI